MNELLTTLHLEVVILDLRIKMLEAIESGHYDLAMTMQLLILVRHDELNAHKFAMPAKQWAVYRTMSPGSKKMCLSSGSIDTEKTPCCLSRKSWVLTLTLGRLSF